MNRSRIRPVALAVAVVTTATASPALAAKHKPPKYTATIEATVHTQAAFTCEADWTSNWTFHGTYTATKLDGLASLDASSRSVTGNVVWTRYFDCGQVLDSGTCTLGVESPIAGAAGYEDGYLRKTAGGYRVELQVDIGVVATSDSCHGFWWGLNHPYLGAQYTEPQGFLAKSKIGQKRIVVPVAGSFAASEYGRAEDGQLNGTVTFVRKGKRR
jgi:hypothetical protein